MQKKNRLAGFAFAGFAGALLMLPLTAAQPAAAADDKAITLTCRQDDTILTGMEWTLYRIGTRHGAEIEFVPELSAYSMDLGDLSADAVDTAAKTIESYIAAVNLPPAAQGQTDASGELTFSGLGNGLYLAAGKTLQVGNTMYYPTTLLLEVNNAGTGLNYDAYPKFYYTDVSSESRRYTVRKVWVDDDDSAHARPQNVTVDLYKDGAIADTVTLSAENDWEYRWDTLDVQSEWLVAEREIPVDYEVMIDYNQSQFLIRNTYHHSQETEVTTTPPAVTTATTATTPPPQITTTAPEKLVQTGQLWWPVLPLSLGGVVLIGAGISMRSGKKKDET
ncbi:MAG: Cna B-type domain-containing protein [Oscillospiraceae bacterium]|nr:Cna B-type domain-containing protein [Oscillospiraceae bacterium]